jgi:hypothetical protein
MEAASGYWKPVYFLLEREGFDCGLYPAARVKALPGRPKTGKLDSIWLAKITERGSLAGNIGNSALEAGVGIHEISGGHESAALPNRDARDYTRQRFAVICGQREAPQRELTPEGTSEGDCHDRNDQADRRRAVRQAVA